MHDAPGHDGVRRWVAGLNQLNRARPALHAADDDPSSFVWIVGDDDRNSIVVYLRRAGVDQIDDQVPVLLNATPTPMPSYRVGVPFAGDWVVLADGDAADFGNSDYRAAQGARDTISTTPEPLHGQPHTPGPGRGTAVCPRAGSVIAACPVSAVTVRASGDTTGVGPSYVSTSAAGARPTSSR
jgi:1,4-alpha-glucan branching enzyme